MIVHRIAEDLDSWLEEVAEELERLVGLRLWDRMDSVGDECDCEECA